MSARIIRADGVNDAFHDALWYMSIVGEPSNSRNGPVLVAPGPVITEYARPWERLLFEPTRDCNHVFHLMETIWMLAGQNRVEWLLQFNSQFGQFAEDDGTQYGAYGHRWRKHHGFDQLSALVTALEKVNNRRAVLQMWDAVYDMGESRKDVPCNTHAYFYNDGNKLDMTVCCRSNDMIWGAYGANVVHFSILQELIASELGVAQGPYYQISNNFHLYTELGPGAKMLAKLRGGGLEGTNPYYDDLTLRHSLLGVGETMSQFIRDCENFVLDSESMHTTFMKNVALPLKKCYLARKAGDTYDVTTIAPSDWRLAFEQWLSRRDHASE